MLAHMHKYIELFLFLMAKGQHFSITKSHYNEHLYLNIILILRMVSFFMLGLGSHKAKPGLT